MPSSALDMRELVVERLRARNEASAAFFAREHERLARACAEMADRFLRGGRLLAFGRGPYATDAQHVAVEFVHPVLVGKRALPALDLSLAFSRWLPAIVRADDVVMGFGPPEGDAEVEAALQQAAASGAQTFALPGSQGAYAIAPPSDDPFIHQELIEVLYHTLWETVHVFFEHRRRGQEDVGESGFLYPFLTGAAEDSEAIVRDVAASIRAKAEEDERLRTDVGRHEADAMAAAADGIARRVAAGGTLIMFGNGGSATDANDWALDCVTRPGGRVVPAISLAMEPASITAIANDIGREEIFLRQLIAQSRPGDVAIAISTSGGSGNVIAALREARRRGLLTVALLGYDGGEIARQGLADLPIVVRSDYIPRIQEIQASIYHVLVEAVDRLLASSSTGGTSP